MSGGPSLRRRFTAAVAVALAAGIGLGALLLGLSRSGEAGWRAEREGLVALNSVTAVAERAADGDGIRRGVAALLQADASVRAVRVVEGREIVASTDPADSGENAAPRNLTREEKPVFDQAQRLRAAFEENRSQGGAVKEVLEVARGAGRLVVAGPLLREGEAVGLVVLEAAPPPAAPGAPLRTALLYILVGTALFAGIAYGIGERRWLLAAAAGLVVVLALVGYGRHTREVLATDRAATDAAVAAKVAAQAARLAELPAVDGQPAADPAGWDVDRFARPLGVVDAQGRIVVSKAAEALAPELAAASRTLGLVGALALLLAAFVGFGYAATTWATLVKYREAYAYITPAMLGMVVLVFFPFLYGIAISFTDSTIYNSDKPLWDIWVGFKNYGEIVLDFAVVGRGADGLVWNYGNFYYTLIFTMIWTVTNVAIGVTVGLALALILNTKGLKLRPIYRVLLVLPWAMPNYITALIWRGMFHQQFGVVNQIVQLFGFEPVAWFEQPFTAYLTALATNGWLSFPFMMVVSLGALQSIPADLYEAARVDGASKWQQFTSVTLPSLKPALIPAIILSVIWTFNMFNIIFLVTAGGPSSSTEILITQAYKFAFEKYRYGYAAAYSTVIFLILLAYGTLQNRMSKATEGV